MRFVLKTYKLVLGKYPLATQMVQTGLLVSAGDLISQTVIEQKSIKYINWSRNMQYFAVGALYLAPTLSTWYKFLDMWLGHGGVKIGVQKVLCDQIFMAPVIITGFLSIVAFIQTQSIEEVKLRLKENYVDVLLANYKLWPAAQLLNFSVIPVQYQLLYVQCVALAWNTYLCYKTKPKE